MTVEEGTVAGMTGDARMDDRPVTQAQFAAFIKEFREFQGEFREIQGEFRELQGEFRQFKGEFRLLKENSCSRSDIFQVAFLVQTAYFAVVVGTVVVLNAVGLL